MSLHLISLLRSVSCRVSNILKVFHNKKEQTTEISFQMCSQISWTWKTPVRVHFYSWKGKRSSTILHEKSAPKTQKSPKNRAFLVCYLLCTTEMAGAVRIELTTRGFGDRCSTCWAIPLSRLLYHGNAILSSINWWAIRDSNPRPTGYEPDALTNWANGPKRKCVYTTNRSQKTSVAAHVPALFYLPRSSPTKYFQRRWA